MFFVVIYRISLLLFFLRLTTLLSGKNKSEWNVGGQTSLFCLFVNY